MARKKVQLAYIADASARRVTFNKRRRGLLKKVSELSTLCGVNACAILYGPYDLQPYVWPSQPQAHRVLMRFKSFPAIDQYRNVNKQLNQESFIRNRIQKINEQLKRHQRENRYMEIEWIYNHALNGEYYIPDVSLLDLSWLLDEKQKKAQHKLAQLKKAPTPPVVQTKPANTGSGIFTAPNIAIPNHITNFVNTTVNVGALENISGINGGTVTGGAMYSTGAANPHNQDGADIINGTVGQEMMASDADIEVLLNQSLFMDVINPPSVLQSGEHMVNYLEGDQNNTQMMMQLGGIPTPSSNGGTLGDIFATNNQMMLQGGVTPPSYNDGLLEDIVNNSSNNKNNNGWMMAANNYYVPMNNYLDG
ncbi:hypothetical protein MKX01_029223 [Papaver californicum]|nr:hypothetical protein MKX01_029223 [Papaver californicum]